MKTMIDYPHELAAISQERDEAVARAEKLEQDFASMVEDCNRWKREASHWSGVAGDKDAKLSLAVSALRAAWMPEQSRFDTDRLRALMAVLGGAQ
jgi:hypothetical protein